MRLSKLFGVLSTIFLCSVHLSAWAAKPIRVTIWDERQPAQKTIYPNFLGNHIADYLKQKGFEVTSVGLEDPDQGLPKDVLDRTDVLVWWGHQRHGEVKMALAKDIAQRVHEGKMSFLPLHSSHWSEPFLQVLALRGIDDAMNSLSSTEKPKAKLNLLPANRHLASKDEALPNFKKEVLADGTVQLNVLLPMCGFVAVRGDGLPSHITTMAPNHPIAKGIPAKFDIPHTEMYGGPFHVPTPDTIIFDEKWDLGEEFPAGCAWKVGKGKCFYFRPGHETFDVFKQPIVLQIVENAVKWLAKK